MAYTEQIPKYGDLMTVKEFKANVKSGGFIDYDGSGQPVKNNLRDTTIDIYPSELYNIPKDATHILWFNR